MTKIGNRFCVFGGVQYTQKLNNVIQNVLRLLKCHLVLIAAKLSNTP